MLTFNVTDHVSGLNLNDWSSGGEYDGVASIFNSTPAVACALGFIISYTVISGFIFGQNRLQLLKRYHWYDV
jgi:hypothetical protein